MDNLRYRESQKSESENASRTKGGQQEFMIFDANSIGVCRGASRSAISKGRKFTVKGKYNMQTLHPSRARYFKKRDRALIERLGHVGKGLVTRRLLNGFDQASYAENKRWVEDVEGFFEGLFADIEKGLRRNRSQAVRVKVIPSWPSEVLALKITRAKRYLGRTKSELLSQWFAMDASLLGNAKNEIDFFGTIQWMKQESVSNIRAYLSGLREFYAKRAS